MKPPSVVSVGRLRIAVLRFGVSPSEVLIDWRVEDRERRWRFAFGRKLWIPLTERYPEHFPGHRQPWRRRILGFDVAWYGRGR